MAMEVEKLYDEHNRLTATISLDIRKNIELLDVLFENCGDVVRKSFVLGRDGSAGIIYIVYIDGLTDNAMIEESIIKPLTYEWKGVREADLFDSILHVEAQTADIKKVQDLDKVIHGVLQGDTAIFVDGYDKAMVISSKRFPLRGISESDSEAGMRGPKDSFNESFRQSTALIRRRIKDAKLRVEQGYIGIRSRTDYAIIYLKGIAKDELVEEVRNRINKYEIDGIFDSGMAEHIMEDDYYSPFPTFQATVRPDKVASGILEGRVAVVFDNSPEVILAPNNFNMLLQASDDYYNRWAVGSFARFMRYIAAFIAISFPGLYIAITVYHSEMLPTKLLYAIASSRTTVTFPIIVEVLIMEFLFELLREAGIRLPGPLGNTIGVVGGLIVGQSAVDAGIVSTMVVIVVALTAIASFAIPNEEFASVFRLLKFFLIITSSVLGLFGFILGLLLVAIHLSGLESFGIPYMLPVSGNVDRKNAGKDFIIRAPIKKMIYRPTWARSGNRVRLRKKEEKDFDGEE